MTRNNTYAARISGFAATNFSADLNIPPPCGLPAPPLGLPAPDPAPEAAALTKLVMPPMSPADPTGLCVGVDAGAGARAAGIDAVGVRVGSSTRLGGAVCLAFLVIPLFE